MAFMEGFVEQVRRIIDEEVKDPEVAEAFYKVYLETMLEEYSEPDATLASFKNLAAAMASPAGRAAKNRGFIDLDLMDWRAWRSHALNDLSDAISDMLARRNHVFLKGTIANEGDIFKRMGIPHSALADSIKTAVGREYHSLAQIGMQYGGGEGDDWAAAAKDVVNAKVTVKPFSRGGKTGFFVMMNPAPKQILKNHGLEEAMQEALEEAQTRGQRPYDVANVKRHTTLIFKGVERISGVRDFNVKSGQRAEFMLDVQGGRVRYRLAFEPPSSAVAMGQEIPRSLMGVLEVFSSRGYSTKVGSVNVAFGKPKAALAQIQSMVAKELKSRVKEL